MKREFRHFLENFAALILASFLFAGSFPNAAFPNGLPFLAFVAYVPVFWVIRRSGFLASVFYGAFYGYASYGLFNYWLSVFHPLAGIIVGSIYSVYLAALFPLLRFTVTIFPRRGYILQWLLWMAYEYIRTLGFLGYPYGITGYSQWNILPLIQIADIAGVWAVSALVVFPSVWLASALNGLSAVSPMEIGLLTKPVKREQLLKEFMAFFRREKISAVCWFLFLIFTLAYGFASPVDYGGGKTARIALIQHNTDPWAPSRSPPALALEEYRNDFSILKRLSDEALAAYPGTDMVVWPETGFVPRIHWHTNFRDDQASWRLVSELLDYLSRQEVPFVIGNDDARRDPAINPDQMQNFRVDYNAAILFDRGKEAGLYRKQRLVPFTEHFPFQKQLPWVYNALRNADTHFWEAGTEAAVMDARGIKFSTPICFEDSFGYISREFVLNGAEIIVNISNDAWSASLPAQMQHLGMAVFRSVENRRAMVRSTASGQTAAIDPNGRIIAMAEAFTQAWISAEVPVLSGSRTFYTSRGDFLGAAFAWSAFIVLIFGIILCILKNTKARRV